jgi:hypothetical protein
MSPKTIVVLGAFAGCMASGAAWSQACDPPGAAELAGLQTQGVIGDAITAMTTSISLAIAQSAGQISGYIQTGNAGLGKVLDGHSAENQRILRQHSEAQVTRDFAPSGAACQSVTGSLGMAAASVNAARTTRVTSATRLQGITGGPGGIVPQQTVIAKNYQNRLMLYAGPRETAAGLGQGQLPDADITPGATIFSYMTYPDQVHAQAAIDAGRNLIAPVPLGDFPMGALQAPGGRAEYQRDLGYRSTVLFGQYIIDRQASERTPNPNDPASASWATDILGAANIPTTDPIPATLSLNQLFDVDVTRRYFNPQWQISLHTMEPAEVARETLRVEALRAALEWRAYQQNGEIDAALATIMAHQQGAQSPAGANANIPVSSGN